MDSVFASGQAVFDPSPQQIIRDVRKIRAVNDARRLQSV